MNKEQWQRLYSTLQEAYSLFNANHFASESGRNRKIREKAGRKVDYAIRRATIAIEQQWEAYELLTGGTDSHEFTRAINYDEFKQPRYFGSDMAKFMKKIQHKIETL